MPDTHHEVTPDPMTRVLPAHVARIDGAACSPVWERRHARPQDRQGNASRQETAHKVAGSAVKRKHHQKETGAPRPASEPRPPGGRLTPALPAAVCTAGTRPTTGENP